MITRRAISRLLRPTLAEDMASLQALRPRPHTLHTINILNPARSTHQDTPAHSSWAAVSRAMQQGSSMMCIQQAIQHPLLGTAPINNRCDMCLANQQSLYESTPRSPRLPLRMATERYPSPDWTGQR